MNKGTFHNQTKMICVQVFYYFCKPKRMNGNDMIWLGNANGYLPLYDDFKAK